jgi:hypothetical protein
MTAVSIAAIGVASLSAGGTGSITAVSLANDPLANGSSTCPQAAIIKRKVNANTLNFFKLSVHP